MTGIYNRLNYFHRNKNVVFSKKKPEDFFQLNVVNSCLLPRKNDPCYWFQAAVCFY